MTKDYKDFLTEADKKGYNPFLQGLRKDTATKIRLYRKIKNDPVAIAKELKKSVGSRNVYIISNTIGEMLTSGISKSMLEKALSETYEKDGKSYVYIYHYAANGIREMLKTLDVEKWKADQKKT